MSKIHGQRLGFSKQERRSCPWTPRGALATGARSPLPEQVVGCCVTRCLLCVKRVGSSSPLLASAAVRVKRGKKEREREETGYIHGRNASPPSCVFSQTLRSFWESDPCQSLPLCVRPHLLITKSGRALLLSVASGTVGMSM